MASAQLQFDPIVIQEANGVAKQQLTVVEQAATLTIADDATAQLAGTLLATIRTRRKAIADAFAPMRQAAHLAHKKAVELEKKADEAWSAAEQALKGEIARYDTECERIRKEQERAAEAERRQREAEQQRLADEQRARLQKESDDNALAVAAVAESVGDHEGAARIVESAPRVAALPVEPVMPTPIAVAPAAKVPGASVRRVYKHRVVNEKAVARAFLMVNERAIADIVKRLGPDAVAVVGAGSIEVFEDRQVAGRAR